MVLLIVVVLAVEVAAFAWMVLVPLVQGTVPDLTTSLWFGGWLIAGAILARVLWPDDRTR